VTPTTKSVQLPGRGVIRLDAATFFEVEELSDPCYIIARASIPVCGFEFVRAEGDLVGLSARPYSERMNTLFFPQIAVLGGIQTQLSVVNYSEETVILTITAYRPNGEPFDPAALQTNPAMRGLEAGEILQTDVAELFGFQGTETRDGWLKVQSTSEAINGSVSYVIGGKSRAAVSCDPQGRKQALFSHIATSLGYFTGISVLNPGAVAANLRIVGMEPDGNTLGTYTSTLQPHHRISKLINELISETAGQAGGFIWITSDQPVYLTSLFGSQGSGVLANIPAQPAGKMYQPDRGKARLRIKPPLAIVQPGATKSFWAEDYTQSPAWQVNGIAGGNPSVGQITQNGDYTAPQSITMPLPITITAEADQQTAGASVDILRKEILVGNLGVIQSVAYLSSLKRLYTAELETLAGQQESYWPFSRPTQENVTTIRDVTFDIPVDVKSYGGEEIPKMIAFAAGNGRECLLLAGKTTGRIIRLDPQTGQSVDVITGLDQPTALVMDPGSGDLLVAERTQVSRFGVEELNEGISSLALRHQRVGNHPRPLTARVFEASAAGITVDRCTTNIYISDEVQGEIQEYDRSKASLTSIAEGLSSPGQLLGLNRKGVSCPHSFHILVVEQGAERVSLIVPEDGSITTWMVSPGVQDVAYLPPESPLPVTEGVLVAEQPGTEGQVVEVELEDLYESEPVNPPPPPEPPGSETVNAADYFPIDPETLCSRTYEWHELTDQGWQSYRFKNEVIGEISVPFATGNRTGSFLCFMDDVSAWINDGNQVLSIMGEADYLASDCVLTEPAYSKAISTWTEGEIFREGVAPVAAMRRDFSDCRIEAGGDEFLVKIQDVTIRGSRYEEAVVLWELSDLGCEEKPDLPCDQYIAPEAHPKYVEWGLNLPTAEEVLQEPGKIGFSSILVFGRGEGMLAGGSHQLAENGGYKLELAGYWDLVSVSCSGPWFTVVEVPVSMMMRASGINQQRQVVGFYAAVDPGDGTLRAFGLVSEDNLLTDFSYPGAHSTWANDINGNGEIAGAYRNPGSDTRHGYVHSGGGFTSVHYDNDEAIDTVVWGSNDQGDLVGVSSTEGSFLWQEGNTIPIMKPGAESTQARDINNNGVIVGQFVDAKGVHGFVFNGGTFETVDFPGARKTSVEGINDQGDLVGSYQGTDTDNLRHGYLRRGGNFTTIDVPCSTWTVANKINNAGDVVGAFRDDNGVQYGFLLTHDPPR
jgi:hypothetical protein